jgi:hypothetical protein
MKRTVLVKTTGIGRTNPLADPVMVPISLIREPRHTDTPPAAHVRPREASVYLQLRPFGTAGASNPDWRE